MSVKLTKMDAGRDGSEVLMMKQIGVSSEEGICSASQLLAKKQEADQDQIRRDYPTCDLGRVIKTVAAYIAFFGGGIGYSIFGATMFHLEKQTGTTTKHMAYIFTYRALGSITGNVLVGLLFNKVPPEALLCLGCMGVTVSFVAVPFCTSLRLLIAFVMLSGFSMGILGGGCNSYMLKIWRLKTRPFTLAMQFVLSVGGSLSPLLVDAFVTDKLDQGQVNNNTLNTDISTTESINISSSYISSASDNISMITEIITNATMNKTASVTSMQLFYPFVIAGLTTTIATLLFAGIVVANIWQFINQGLGSGTASGNSSKAATVKNFVKLQEEHLGPMRHKALLIILAVLTMIYGGMEYSYGSWILAFCVKYLEISFQKAALISTSFWASVAAGRGLGAIMAKLFSPAVTILFCLYVSTVALIIFTFACTLHIAVAWTCSIVVGLCFAPILGNCFAFSQEEFNMPSRMTTLFVFMLYLGFILMPALIGYLYTAYTPLAFLYVVTVGGVFIALIFSGILLYRQFCIKRRTV